MTSLPEQTSKRHCVAVLVAVMLALAVVGCGSSGDSSTTIEATLPTVTAPIISTATTPVPGQQATTTSTAATGKDEGAKGNEKSGGESEPRVEGAAGSDQAKAQGGGSSSAGKTTGPTDAQKAKHPGAYGGGGSSASGQSDQQKAGG
jgi:hypothetical protein